LGKCSLHSRQFRIGFDLGAAGGAGHHKRAEEDIADRPYPGDLGRVAFNSPA
jgi:hypothetical protein